MLRRRLLTAAVLIPLIVAGVWFLPEPAFAAILAVFLLAASLEWGRLMGEAIRPASLLFLTGMGVSLIVLWVFHGVPELVSAVLALAALWWIACFVWLGFYPFGDLKKQRWRSLLRGCLGGLVILPSFLALVVLHASREHGPAWVLFLLVMVWAADTGAYFAGRAWGRHALLPLVSPGKTWEGLAGGFVLGLVVPLITGIWALGLRDWNLLAFLLLCLGVIAASVVGDLTISAMKRLAGIKDSGRLFPGHGGVLDRMDSLLAAAPCLLLGLMGLGLVGLGLQ